MEDLQNIIQDDQRNIESKQEIFDDFYEFRTRISRLVKEMVDQPEKRLLISVRRNLSKSPFRQVEYTIYITTEGQIFNSEEVVAIPAAPDYPDVEQEKDLTKTL